MKGSICKVSPRPNPALPTCLGRGPQGRLHSALFRETACSTTLNSWNLGSQPQLRCKGSGEKLRGLDLPYLDQASTWGSLVFSVPRFDDLTSSQLLPSLGLHFITPPSLLQINQLIRRISLS